MSKSKKAVVVDDDKKTIILVEDILIPLGFQVFCAEEGKDFFGIPGLLVDI